MTKPAITVITPVFHGARYVDEAIRSVMAQEVLLRHVVVDDGSTDDTLSVVDQHAGAADDPAPGTPRRSHARL